jgi:hypothetical protein
MNRLDLIKADLPKITEQLCKTMMEDAIPLTEVAELDSMPVVSIVFSFKDGGPDIRISLSISEESADQPNGS